MDCRPGNRSQARVRLRVTSNDEGLLGTCWHARRNVAIGIRGSLTGGRGMTSRTSVHGDANPDVPSFATLPLAETGIAGQHCVTRRSAQTRYDLRPSYRHPSADVSGTSRKSLTNSIHLMVSKDIVSSKYRFGEAIGIVSLMPASTCRDEPDGPTHFNGIDRVSRQR